MDEESVSAHMMKISLVLSQRHRNGKRKRQRNRNRKRRATRAGEEAQNSCMLWRSVYVCECVRGAGQGGNGQARAGQDRMWAYLLLSNSGSAPRRGLHYHCQHASWEGARAMTRAGAGAGVRKGARTGAVAERGVTEVAVPWQMLTILPVRPFGRCPATAVRVAPQPQPPHKFGRRVEERGRLKVGSSLKMLSGIRVHSVWERDGDTRQSNNSKMCDSQHMCALLCVCSYVCVCVLRMCVCKIEHIALGLSID